MSVRLSFIRITCTRAGCDWHIQTYVSSSLIDEWSKRVSEEHDETCPALHPVEVTG